MRSVFAAAFLAVSLLGCAGAASSSASDAQDVTANASLVGVKVEAATLKWGGSAIYGGDPSGVHAFLFAGEAGDAVIAKSSSGTPGTVYILAQANGAFTVVASSTVASTTQGSVSATLAASGTYAIAYAMKPSADDADSPFPASYSVSLTLSGKPASAASKLAIAVRDAWDSSADYTATEKEFIAVDPVLLPAQVRNRYKTWNGASASTWTVGSRAVYVVESRTESSVLIAFFDLAGNPIASGSASEGEEFAWND